MKHLIISLFVLLTCLMSLIAQKSTTNKKYSEPKTLLEYENRYAAGEKSQTFLKNYILKRQQAGLIKNDELIEKYVLDLKVSDFNSYDQVLFILKAGPILDGTAYKLAKLNTQLYDSIFKTESFTICKAINNAIISNSLNSAIASKNKNRAFEVERFTQNSWGRNYKEGLKNSTFNRFRYYKGIKDTATYLLNAKYYYDNYYLNLTVDSVRKLDSLNFIKAKDNARLVSSIQMNDSTVMKKYSFVVAKDVYAVDLNNAAWDFYKMAKNNNDYLFKALIWIRRAIEISPKPSFYDTYAHLLYQLKMFDEALSMQRKAIEFANEAKIDSSIFKIEYEKMTKRTL